MAICIQSLSWTLTCSLAQGFIVYTSLWLVLKLVPASSANVRYRLSLSALTVLLVWFVATWQQFHYLMDINEQSVVAGQRVTDIQQLRIIGAIKNYGSYRPIWFSIAIIAPWLSAFYLVGLVFMLLRLSAGMLQLFSLRKNGISPPDTMLDELLISLKNKLYFKGSAQLFISAKAQVPMVIGCLKPIILMPAAAIAQLSTEQLETILLHELAHIKRYDYLVNILQTVVETMLFFNPFVWMASAIIRREREHCCDDLVLGHTREPLFYATALAALANHPAAISVFAVAASGQSNYLFNRIKRIMEMKKNPFSYSRMVAAILIVTIITGSVAWLTPSFARAKKDKPAKVQAIPSAPVSQAALPADTPEEMQLVNRLIDDRLIDETKGFVVEKRQSSLYIDGMQQTDEVAAKYLSGLKKEAIRVEVYSLLERLKRHPGASFLQLLVPVKLSSPCVDYQAKKDNC